MPKKIKKAIKVKTKKANKTFIAAVKKKSAKEAAQAQRTKRLDVFIQEKIQPI